MATLTAPAKSEVMEHERQFWEASKGDAAKLRDLCADEFTFVMGEGVSNFKREEFIGMMTNGDYKLRSFRLDDGGAQFRELGPNAATVAYKADSEFELGGKAQKNTSWYSSTWVRTGDRWKCALVTESAVK